MNLLPYDGACLYHAAIFDEAASKQLFQMLLKEIPWQADEVVLFGKKHITNRKMAWFADDGLAYTYSNSRKEANNWTPTLLEIKKKIEDFTNEKFNACLLNLYHDGNEGMGWHSDDEKEIVANSTIASVSLGASRNFRFRHKQTKETAAILLEDGSILLMKNETQHYWQHTLPKSKRVVEPRINLTFRQMRKPIGVFR